MCPEFIEILRVESFKYAICIERSTYDLTNYLEVFDVVKKIAITLGILAVIGFVLYGVINVFLPGAGDAAQCVLQNALKGDDIKACASMLTVDFRK